MDGSLQQLQNDDPAARADALRGALHREPALADIPHLRAMSRDPAAIVRLTVLEHISRTDLRHLAEPEARDWFSQTNILLARGLSDPDAAVRRQALAGLLRAQPGAGTQPDDRTRQLVDRYSSRVRAHRIAPLLADPSPPVQRLAFELAELVDAAPLANELRKQVGSPDLEISLAAVRLLHKGGRLTWLELFRTEPRVEVRRLIAELGTTSSPPRSIHIGLLIEVARGLPHEEDSALQQLLLAYLSREGRRRPEWSDCWRPSLWHRLALLLYVLRDDPELGPRAAELYAHAEAERQAAYTALLSQPPSRAQIGELQLCGDGRALPVLEQIARAGLYERPDSAGDDNGAGGMPYPDIAYPLTPPALAAIDAIQARLSPPRTLAPWAALPPEWDHIFRAALQREIRGQVQLPERLRFNRVYVLLPDGTEREDERRRTRTVRYLLGYAGEPYLDFFEDAEDYSRHCRIDARGVLSALEEFRDQWGGRVYPDDPERTERERQESQAANTRLRGLLRQKGLL